MSKKDYERESAINLREDSVYKIQREFQQLAMHRNMGRTGYAGEAQTLVRDLEISFGMYEVPIKAYFDLFGPQIEQAPIGFSEYVARAGLPPLNAMEEQAFHMYYLYRQIILEPSYPGIYQQIQNRSIF